MDWKKLLGSITISVDEELQLRHAYLEAENRLLRQQITSRVQLTDDNCRALAELGQKLGKQVLEETATVAKPDTILAWHRKFVDHKSDTSHSCTAVGRPRIDKAIEDLVVRMARENRAWSYDRCYSVAWSGSAVGQRCRPMTILMRWRVRGVKTKL